MTMILPIYTLINHNQWRSINSKYKSHLEYHTSECIFKDIYIDLNFISNSPELNQNVVSILNSFEQAFVHPKSSRLWFSLQPYVNTQENKRLILHFENLKPEFVYTLKETTSY